MARIDCQSAVIVLITKLCRFLWPVLTCYPFTFFFFFDQHSRLGIDDSVNKATKKVGVSGSTLLVCTQCLDALNAEAASASANVAPNRKELHRSTTEMPKSSSKVRFVRVLVAVCSAARGCSSLY